MEIALRGHGGGGWVGGGGGGMGVVDAKYSAVKYSVVPSRWVGGGALVVSVFRILYFAVYF